MKPIDRFNLDLTRIQFIANDEYNDENFFIEEDRSVNKTNVFPINSERYECPVDLRGKVIQVRYDRNRRDQFIVYFNGTRMGKATPLNQQHNARQIRGLI